ncbi:conserved protein of unknown function [Pseudorhizobium banfieldiae]|uniref:Uncharacterized protein n=1 Tax=Pseudorhizobium banfieldiae TaxID=1125847 RepID=L0NDB8_9HYPH|nr:hypothetical protein [Pseudorhizobium banfieldiae]CAD6605997.1 hypothetical protein RNT25_01761 [arsenite-oxidising bacterium NT-25]CCF19108.1 conserved protein of unknown function [Pseudorhizobium banfieldiae]
MSGRTPCINPKCRRTADAAKFPDEMICGKCFKALPQQLREDFKFAWRQYRKWDRRRMKTTDELKLQKVHSVMGMWGRRIDATWVEIKKHLTADEKPEGLDAFLEEMGL